jgi:Ca2+-binding RTX toxin-like protein
MSHQNSRIREFYVNEEPLIDITLGVRPSGLLRAGQSIGNVTWIVSGTGGPVMVAASDTLVTTQQANDTARARFTMPSTPGRWTITAQQDLINPIENNIAESIIAVVKSYPASG